MTLSREELSKIQKKIRKTTERMNRARKERDRAVECGRIEAAEDLEEFHSRMCFYWSGIRDVLSILGYTIDKIEGTEYIIRRDKE